MNATSSADAVRKCDNPDGSGGIMAYRNQCHFLRTHEDDANAANAPDLVEPESDDPTSAGAQSDQQGFASAPSWEREQQLPVSRDGSAQGLPMQGQGVPVVPPTSTPLFEGVKSPGARPMFQFIPGEAGADANDMSGSPGAGSGGPTPNSSTASEHKARIGQVSGSGSTSYDASPAPAPQTLGSQAGVEGQAGFYDASGFPMAQGVPGDQRFPVQGQMGFGMASGWGPVQAGQPVADGVLRSLMNMGPMDAMDLSSWESGN